jgi:hypothetical protein
MMDFVINAYGGRGLALMSSFYLPWFSLNAIFVMHFVIVHQKVEKSKERIK